VNWKLISSKYLFKNRWLTVRKDHVVMPSGTEIDDFYVLEYPDWVNVIAITEDDKIIIEQQYRHGIQQVNFEIPAGGIESGESPIEAAKRELLEETGYSGGEWQEFMLSAPNPNSMNNICHTFLAKGVRKTSTPHPEKTEDIKIHLCTIEQVTELLANSSIIEGIMQAPLYKYINNIKKYGIQNSPF